MALYISEEFNLETFEPWGGAVSRLIEIKDLGIVDEAQEYIEDMLDNGDPVTLTDINDIIWFEMDDFIQNFKEDEEE